MKPLSLYVHWPFCLSKCPYCDFNSRVLPSDLDEMAWREAYCAEIAHYARCLPEREIATIYFGGGTPSLMSASLVGAIIEAVGAQWKIVPNCEITLEANPTSSSAEVFKAFRLAGVGRLSLGVQALDDESLRFLGRRHTAREAKDALSLALTIFERVSFDLIYGRAGQTPRAWERELHEALSFGAKHMALYQLTIEPDTAFGRRAPTEMLTPPDDDIAQMYEDTQIVTAKAGLPAYEISNHAARGQEGLHNLAYWRYDDFVGIGAGAHGRFVAQGVRWATENVRDPFSWLTQTLSQGQGLAQKEALDEEQTRREALMMGLRLSSGLDKTIWRAKFGETLALCAPPSRRRALEDEGLLFEDEHSLRATPKGLERLNAVLAFLTAPSQQDSRARGE